MASSSPLYDYSVVPFVNTLKNLVHLMDKAEQHAKEKGENVEDYTKLQLHPDMKDFAFQIQRLSDAAKSVVVNIGGVDASAVAMADDETTWDELKARVTKTVTALEEKGVAKDFEGKEDGEVSLMGGKFKFTARSYLQTFAVPNFYFHVTTAYALLRMQGVPVGKIDYLAGAKGIEGM